MRSRRLAAYYPGMALLVHRNEKWCAFVLDQKDAEFRGFRNGSVADNRFKSLIIMKLYVGNFSFDMTERTLRELFEPFGTVSEVKLITDRETGQSRGFGFVTMGNVSEGNAAIHK